MSRARVLSLERRLPRPTSVERFAQIFGDTMTPEERKAYFTMALHYVGTRTFTDDQRAFVASGFAKKSDEELRDMARRLAARFVQRLADHERDDPTCATCTQRRARAR